MAEAVIGSIAEKIIEILGSQAIEKVGKLRGIKHEVKALRDTVSILQLVLDDAEEQYHHPLIQIWVKQLKDAFYEAQDVLEEFNIEVMRRELRGHNEMMKAVRTFFSSSNQLALKLKMSDKVRGVRVRIEALNANRIPTLKAHPKKELRNREETHSFIREEDIKGREDDKERVMKFLLNSDMEENVSILPIVGIGGLGKTALAKYVYGDSKFDLKMWVCVSTDFDVKKIVKKMLACATGQEPIENTMELLQNKLRAEIDGKKYLLVLDDVWSIEQATWLSLKTLLVGGAKGSKILITTRISSVAKITNIAQPHFLGGLSESASLELLMQMAGRKIEEIQDSHMLAIGKEMVRKCSGVPLVIRTVGSLLLQKSKLEWLYFKDNVLPKVSQKDESIISILRLSYDHLPSHLKQCFAFCSLFPKDYEMDEQTLVNLWVAEGFIQLDKSRNLEDIAHGYFMDLLWNNFFQDYKKYPFHGGTCKMHDLMHDLACSVAGIECWVAWDNTKPIHERTRHISHDSTFNLMGKTIISCLKASALRTLLSATKYRGREPTSQADLRQLIQSFKRLRILDLHSANIEKVPRFICKLKHLTYLDLSNNKALKRLPNSITRLHNLQTLNLHYCESLEELPRGIRKLVSLRNLDIDGCDKLSFMPCGLGQLSSLQRLSCFILPKNKALAKKYCGLGELNRLNIRGTLSIENLGSVTNAVEESMTANLIEKRSLEALCLSWGTSNITDEAMIMKRDKALLDGLRPPDNLQKLIINGYNGESFPRWMPQLPNLVELELTRCKRCKHFPQFGLSELKRLVIFGMDFLEYLPGECLASFTSLESLRLNSLPRLTSLPLGLWHLSKLVDLDIWNCEELDLSKDESGNIILDFHGLQSLRSVHFFEIPKLESLPQWILQLRSLERLSISRCPNFKELSEQIEKCEEVDISKEESGNILDFHGGLQSLHSVFISHLPKLTSLPQWLLQAHNLERLEILVCDNLKDIPEQIEALQSLQNLIIKFCSPSTSFLESMGRLTSLTHLNIFACRELKESCQRQASEDWDKIVHIPNIRFGL